MLQFVLQNLPAQLRNKTLILGGDADVSNLCAFLCYMVMIVLRYLQSFCGTKIKNGFEKSNI